MQLRKFFFKLMWIHFAVNCFLVLLIFIGFTHQSQSVREFIGLTLFIWPLWLALIFRGVIQLFTVPFGLLTSAVFASLILMSFENSITSKVFESEIGSIYVADEFDFDASRELGGTIRLQKQLPLGFIKINSTLKLDKPIGDPFDVIVKEGVLKVSGSNGDNQFKINDGKLEKDN